MSQALVVDGDGHIMEEPNEIWTPERIDHERWGDWIPRSPYLNAVWISGVALLMVSNVPTVSLKRIRIQGAEFVRPDLLIRT